MNSIGPDPHCLHLQTQSFLSWSVACCCPLLLHQAQIAAAQNGGNVVTTEPLGNGQYYVYANPLPFMSGPASYPSSTAGGPAITGTITNVPSASDSYQNLYNNSFDGQAAQSTATGLGVTALLTGGSAIGAYGPQLLAGAEDAFAAYQAAQAGYSLTTAAATGAAVSGVTYTASAGAGAAYNYLSTGANFSSSFDQKFSLAGLAAASTVGAYTNIFSTSMFNLAGIPNSFSNILTLPGAVIRVNGLALGQAAGKAAQGAVNQSQ